MFCDASKHPGANFFLGMKSKSKVGVTRFSKDLVGSFLSFNLPAKIE